MPVVESVDYEARRIHLSLETADAEVDTLDVFKEVRALRRTTEAHRRYLPMIEAGGNIEKVAGLTYTQPYVRLLRGCRIVPYNASHNLTIVRDTFTDDGFSGRDCFDRTPLSESVEVDIDFSVHEVELRLVSVGSAVLPADIAAIITGIFSQAQATPLHADARKINGTTLTGSGVTGNEWGPA
jgi:hypothetical protein